MEEAKPTRPGKLDRRDDDMMEREGVQGGGGAPSSAFGDDASDAQF